MDKKDLWLVSLIPSKNTLHDLIDSLIGEEVDEFFFGKYCVECSLFKACKHRFNAHCHKVVSDHLKACIEIASLVKDTFLTEAKKREVEG